MMESRYELKNGVITHDPRLDRIVHFDDRSLNYRAVPKGAKRTIRSYTHNFRKHPGWLDQGREGACVGFGWAHELMCWPQEYPMTNELARGIYFEAQKRDPWPGGAYPGASPFYEGTSVLGGAQAARMLLDKIASERLEHEFRWCMGGNDVVTVLSSRPVVIGVPWMEDMFNTDANGFIHASGRVAGGHCTVLRGQKIVWKENTTHYEPKDVERELTVIKGRNSWGQGGDFLITLADLDKLLAMDGEACIIGAKRR